MSDLVPTTRREQLFSAAAAGSEPSFVPTKREEQLIAEIQGGGGGGGGGTDSNAVHYSADSDKTDAERAAALANVGGEPQKLTVTVTHSSGVYSADKTFSDIVAANTAKADIVVVYSTKKFHPIYVGSSYADFVYLEAYSTDKAFKIEQLRATSSGWTYSEVFSAVLPWSDADNGQSPVVDGSGHYNLVKLEAASTVVTDLSSTSITLASAAANTIYEYGELSALTVTAATATGDFIIRFTSGSTATTTNFPASMVFPEAFAAEVSTRYEINVSNGYALVASWPVS